MPRNYQRKCNQQYNDDVINDAIRRVKNGTGKSIYCASKEIGLPKTTFLRHCQMDLSLKLVRPRVLGNDEELRLVEVIIYLRCEGREDSLHEDTDGRQDCVLCSVLCVRYRRVSSPVHRL